MVLHTLVDDRDLKQILTHKRVAPDGIAYTKQEFQDFYGESQGHYRWLQADVAPDDLADVATSSSMSRAAISPQAPATEHAFQAPATEHAFHAPLATMLENPSHVEIRRLPTVDLPPVDVTQPVVAPVHVEQPLRLMPEDVLAIQHAERDRGPPRSLHQLARNALNHIEDRDPRIDVSLDNEFPWREYIVAHNESDTIIGTGIVQARAVFFKDQKDRNRGGASRLDFCFVRSDDTVCRVHPGIKRSGDAKLRFAPHHPA